MDLRPTRRETVLLGAAALGGVALGASPMGPISQASDSDAEGRERVLRELLALNRTTHPIYRGGLANHLSMELCALFALGATSERLREFSGVYSRQLEPFPAAGFSVSKDSWRSRIGQPDALHGFVQYFGEELRSRGREAALRDVLEVVCPSLSSDLFHCMIRTAYGVRFGDDQEIAHGLAYWAIKPQPLGALPRETGTERDFSALLARVRATPALAGAKLTGNSNPGRMRQASQIEGFAEIANALEVGDGTLASLARTALELYATTLDFTALHAVTSTHALRVLLPYFPDRALALRHHSQGLLAAYVRMGAPAVAASVPQEVPAWPAAAAKAIASADDHDAKFVDSCRDEEQAYGDSRYRFAAARRVKLA